MNYDLVFAWFLAVELCTFVHIVTKDDKKYQLHSVLNGP